MCDEEAEEECWLVEVSALSVPSSLTVKAESSASTLSIDEFRPLICMNF